MATSPDSCVVPQPVAITSVPSDKQKLFVGRQTGLEYPSLNGIGETVSTKAMSFSLE